MSLLVDKLCSGSHPVTLSLRPERTRKALQDCLDRGYVHVKFTDTIGGTELGIRLDAAAKDAALHALADGGNTIPLRGSLSLDGVPVQCVAEVEPNDFQGAGHLEKLAGEVQAQ